MDILAAFLAATLVLVVAFAALWLRERRRSPRDPRDGLTMLVSREVVELRVR